MTIHQLTRRCWVLDDPACDGGQPHFDDPAGAQDALAERKEENPDTQAQAREEDAPCWVAVCDGPECGELYTDDDEGICHFASAEGLQAWMGPDGWTVRAPDEAFCPACKQQDAIPPPPSPAEQEKAGQLRLPGVIP